MKDAGANDLSDVTVIAPAYNEEQALPSVLAALDPLRRRGAEVVVVDDGSTDDTSRVARDAGARLVRLERNVGKAGAVRAGLEAVTRPKIVLIDADATYPVDAIPAFARLLDEYDVVLGARTEGRSHIPFLNRFGNAALRTTIQWFSGFGSVDPLTGLYGIRREHLAAMELRSRGFGLEAEMGVKAARMGLRWTDVPITYAERIGVSKLRPFRDGFIITWTVIRALFSGPRIQAAAGRADRLRPAPLAMATTALALVLLTVAAITLGAVAVLSLVALFDPDVPLAATLVGPGIAMLAAAVVLWRLASRWGRPGPGLLAPVALGGIAGAAVLMGAGVLGAEAVGVVPARHGLTARVLLLGSVAALVLSPLAYLLALRAPRVRRRVDSAIDTVAVPATRGERLALAGILLLFAILVMRYIAISPLFGFDEAIYANTARSWLEGTPNTGWSAHRSPGISLLGLPAVPLGSEAAFRFVGLLSGALCIVAAWALGRRLGGPAAGLLAALLVAAVPELLLSSSLFLTDAPSAGIVLLLMLAAWHELEDRPAPSRRLLLLAPIAAAAFYVRYGASLPILFVAGTSLLLWHRQLVAAWKLTLAAAGLLGLLLLPHLVQAVVMTGAPWGIARMAQTLAASGSPLETLLSFLRMWPGRFAGIVADWLILLALVAWPVVLFRARGLRSRHARALTFLLVPAVGQFVLISLVAMAHPRYILLPILLAAIAGSVVAVRLAQQVIPRSGRALAALAAVAAIVSVLGTAALEVRTRLEYVPNQSGFRDATDAIRADAGDASCGVLGFPTPQITWYTRCATFHFGFPPTAGRDQRLPGDRRYMFLLVGESDRYPTGELRDEYLSLVDSEPIAVIRDPDTGAPMSEIYRLPPQR